jgi:monofunctional biosynthetic peptidoglycan transglycosylase
MRVAGRGALIAALLVAPALATADPVTTRIEPDPAAAWTAVNDAVMGGVSEGRVARADDGAVLFTGRLSFANNGGFASARRPVVLPAGNDGLEIVCRGDGRRYKLALYTDLGASGQSYQAELITQPGASTRVALAWRDFAPRFRGRAQPDAPPLRPERVRYLGLLIADRGDAPFRLEVESIVTVRDPR